MIWFSPLFRRCGKCFRKVPSIVVGTKILEVLKKARSDKFDLEFNDF